MPSALVACHVVIVVVPAAAAAAIRIFGSHLVDCCAALRLSMPWMALLCNGNVYLEINGQYDATSKQMRLEIRNEMQ